MARRRQASYEKYSEADNGFAWTRKRASAVSIEYSSYCTKVFGVEYELEKRGGTQEMPGWYLYSIKGSTHFFGEYCASTLLPAIDEASKLIVQADQRGEGYEKETGT